MIAIERPRFWRIRNPIMWACVATLGFVALIVLFGLAPTCNGDFFPKGDCPPKWRHLYAAPPNEVGDTLAGLAGVLAFIWLIATVLLQSVELSEQRRVLALQKEEMEEQRIATQEMASAMGSQSQIFLDEQRQRDEIRAKNLLDEKLFSVVDNLQRSYHNFKWKVNWQREHPFAPEGIEKNSYDVYAFDGRVNDLSKKNSFAAIREIADSSTRRFKELERLVSGKSFMGELVSFDKSPNRIRLELTISKLEELLAISERLSEADKQFLENTQILILFANLLRLVELDLWANNEEIDEEVPA